MEADENHEDLDALTSAREALAEHRRNETSLVGTVGMCLGGLERWHEAEITLREAIAIGEEFEAPAMYDWHQLLAGALEAQEQHKDALKHNRLALESASRERGDSALATATARYFLACQLIRMDLYEEALSMVPEDGTLGTERYMAGARAKCLRGLERIPEAREEAAKALAACESDEQRLGYLDELADLLFYPRDLPDEQGLMKHLEETRLALAKLRAEPLIDHPHEAAKVGIVGLKLALLERYSEAEEAFRESIAIGEQHGTPMMHQWHQLLGSSLANQGRQTEALEHNRLALDYAERNREEEEIAYYRYFLAAQLEQMQHYEEALSLTPEDGEQGKMAHTLCLRALCLHGLNRKVEARAAATNALAACSTDEGRADMRVELADVL